MGAGTVGYGVGSNAFTVGSRVGVVASSMGSGVGLDESSLATGDEVGPSVGVKLVSNDEGDEVSTTSMIEGALDVASTPVAEGPAVGWRPSGVGFNVCSKPAGVGFRVLSTVTVGSLVGSWEYVASDGVLVEGESVGDRVSTSEEVGPIVGISVGTGSVGYCVGAALVGLCVGSLVGSALVGSSVGAASVG